MNCDINISAGYRIKDAFKILFYLKWNDTTTFVIVDNEWKNLYIHILIRALSICKLFVNIDREQKEGFI